MDFSLQGPIAAYSNVFGKSTNETVTVSPTLLINILFAVTVTSLWPQRKIPLWTCSSEPTRVTRSIYLLRFVRSPNSSSSVSANATLSNASRGPRYLVVIVTLTRFFLYTSPPFVSILLICASQS